MVAPHHLAAEAGLAVLREGGNAAEASVAVAAALAVVYPHMNGIGGDSFWLLRDSEGKMTGIAACGRTGAGVSPDMYRANGLTEIPPRGPLAANTVAGTIGGWQAVLAAARRWGGRMPVPRILEAAIDHAARGCPMAEGLAGMLNTYGPGLASEPGFADAFPADGTARAGASFVQPALAESLRLLAADGLDSFYRGDLAQAIAQDLADVGAPVGADDLANDRAAEAAPLSVDLSVGRAFNMPPPTQGAASLMILALYDRLRAEGDDDVGLIHRIVQATTSAFYLRDREIGDPEVMRADPADWLTPAALAERAAGIDPETVLRWGGEANAGDTVWFGVIDGDGQSVSAIQSIFWEFGSGVVLPRSGILWQNRGSSFMLDGDGPRTLAPNRIPFHTLNPAMAELNDGRVIVYGTMGGDGQPQTQAAMMARYAWLGQSAQQAVTGPRWLMGKTWGEADALLKLEDRFGPEVAAGLADMGYPMQQVGAFDSLMGHAGMLVLHPDGTLEGGADPRSDGTVATF